MAGISDANEDKFWCHFCAGNNVTLIIWSIGLLSVNRTVNGPLIRIILKELVQFYCSLNYWCPLFLKYQLRPCCRKHWCSVLFVRVPPAADCDHKMLAKKTRRHFCLKKESILWKEPHVKRRFLNNKIWTHSRKPCLFSSLHSHLYKATWNIN